MLKGKIINDPIHGFITIPQGIIQSIIDHPYLQRLRRIKQLGLTDYVYPGAVHTRFHHALGAMHLMGVALESLRSKGHIISEEEEQAGRIAVLCHDLGHGPFSHALEYSFAQHIDHEAITLMLMNRLNQELGQGLSLAIEMFEGKYHRPFFHQLISSQLDVDRLDYLKRDSFFTGVIEGGVGTSRILKMIDLVNESIVVEEKAIYSVEHFLSARRLMYWQVYLHKTAIAAETLTTLILKRASTLRRNGIKVPLSGALGAFMDHTLPINPDTLQLFMDLDDDEVMVAIKSWQKHPDFILSDLCSNLMKRDLPVVHLSFQPFSMDYLKTLKWEIQSSYNINEEETEYFLQLSQLDNTTYKPQKGEIGILKRDGRIFDVEELSNQINMGYLSQEEKKYCLYAPKKLA